MLEVGLLLRREHMGKTVLLVGEGLKESFADGEI